MQYRFRLPILAAGVVLATVLASLVPTTSSQAHAQITVSYRQGGRYYQPYGQGRYGGYGRGYSASARTNYNMFRSRGATFSNRTYGYSRSRYIPSGYGNTFSFGIAAPVRVYGRPVYYRPSYGGPVYVPFSYSEY